jgi:hypothetical protein
MDKWQNRIATVVMGVGILVPAAWAEQEKKATPAASPHPAVSPGTAGTDPATGAPVIGVGRAHNAVKSSGDEGGTAAGMPGKGPDSGR